MVSFWKVRKDLRTVQKLMGPKTTAMTFRYAHLVLAYPLSAVEQLAEINRAIRNGKSDAPTDPRTNTNVLEQAEPRPAYVQ